MRNKLKKLREKHGYSTQKNFAEKIDMPLSTYQHIESGIRFPRKEQREKIMKALKTKSLSIFDIDESLSSLERGEVIKLVCNLMNDKGSRKYSVNEVSAIKNCIHKELRDRSKQNIDIMSRAEEGKKYINDRIAEIANIKLGKENNLNGEDVRLCKECTREEFEIRMKKSTWCIPKMRKKFGYDPETGFEREDN